MPFSCTSAASDATNAFEDVGHSADARELSNKYLVGVLDDTPPKSRVCASNGYHFVTQPDSEGLEEGLVKGLGWKCTWDLVCSCTSDWLLVSILLFGNANLTKAIFASGCVFICCRKGYQR